MCKISMHNEILLLPDKFDVERDAIAKKWKRNGGEVKYIGKFWIKPNVKGKRITIYGHDSFCLVLAQVLDLEMVMVRDEFIAELPNIYLSRRIFIKKFTELEDNDFPRFIKPVTPKLFKAEVFYSFNYFKKTTNVINDTEYLICSEVITVIKEVRAFILNRTILDLAYYEGEGELNGAREFIDSFLEDSSIKLPHTFVLDIGFNDKDKWFVIEFNSSWGSGLNSCDPNKVIDCIREATLGNV